MQKPASLVVKQQLAALKPDGASKHGRHWRDRHVSSWTEGDKGACFFVEGLSANDWVRHRPDKLLTSTNCRLGMLFRRGGTSTNVDPGKQLSVANSRGVVHTPLHCSPQHTQWQCLKMTKNGRTLGHCKIKTIALTITQISPLVRAIFPAHLPLFFKVYTPILSKISQKSWSHFFTKRRRAPIDNTRHYWIGILSLKTALAIVFRFTSAFSHRSIGKTNTFSVFLDSIPIS